MTFHDALQRSERARNQVEAARAALFKHEDLPLESGGSKMKGTGSDSSVLVGSSVALFNVNTERWVLFEISESGQPPEGALAYAPLPGRERGEWIVDMQEMSDRERQNVKLYYTEAGLAILREAGLEM
jgi:hypothetical protein